MGFLKAKPDYVSIPPDFKPGRKNGHLSEVNPAYLSVGKPIEEFLKTVWTQDISLAEFKRFFTAPPPAFPDDCPKIGKDINVSYAKVTVRDHAEIDVKIYKSMHVQPNAALLLKIHGGGWVVGTMEIEEPENLYMAGLPNVVLVNVDYRMAPEHPYPTPLNDCLDVLRWCKSQASSLGINPEKIIVAGCSAGGNLAACVSIKARDEGITGIVGQHLSIPVTCHPKFFNQVPNKEKYELLSYIQNVEAGMVNSVQMEAFWDWYVGTNPKPDVLHSPLLSTDLRGLPQTMVHVAGLDPLRDEGIAYAEALKAANVPTTLHTYKGVPHGFYGLFDLDCAKHYYRRGLEFVHKCAKGERAHL